MEVIDMEAPAHGKAAASLALGIVGIAFWFFGYSAAVSLILGIIGLVLSAQAKKEGNNESIRTAGFILCLISTIVGALIFVSCIACAACGMAIGGASFMGALYS
jgi:hypothetical protein